MYVAKIRKEKIDTVVNSLARAYSPSNIYDELLEKVADFHGLKVKTLKSKLAKRYKAIDKAKTRI